MPKLHLKRTPEEETNHQARKRRRKEKKSEKKARRVDSQGADRNGRKWSSSDEEPGPFRTNTDGGVGVDYERIRAEMEDAKFREKLFDALGDDEHLDSVEARLNDYAHVPQHWRSGRGHTTSHPYNDSGDVESFLKMDPRHMDDDEYAEWIRLGMYR
jgi:hypothetical protein